LQFSPTRLKNNMHRKNNQEIPFLNSWTTPHDQNRHRFCYSLLSIFFFNMNINQMKQSINIRCMQHFLYFESHKKSLKLLHIIVCFNVLSISSTFTISTYFINECMYLDEISRKQWYRVHVQTMVQK
jgi:hypothetical protein